MRSPATIFSAALLLGLAVFTGAACSKELPKPSDSTPDAASTAYPIDPDLKLPEGLDPNAPMVRLIEPEPSAEPADSTGGAQAATGAKTDGGRAAPAASSAAAVNPAGVIKLLSNGSPPRQKLRYKFTPGQSETLTEELRSSASVQGGGMDRPDTQSPPIKMVMLVNPTAVTPEGDFRYEYKISRVDLAGDTSTMPPDSVAQARQVLGGLVGFGGWSVVSPRGVTKGMGDLTPPQGANEETMQLLTQFRQALKDITPPFPEEEVGNGAQWVRTTTMAADEGGSATQKETYTLSDLAGSGGKLDVALEQSAAPQLLPPQDGITRKIEASTASGRGTTVFDVTRVVPQSQTMDATSSLVQSATRGAETQRMRLTIRLGLKITGTKP